MDSPDIANDFQTTSSSDATTSSTVGPTEHSRSDSAEEQNTTGPSEQTDPLDIANGSQTTSSSDTTTSSIVEPTEHSGSDSAEEQNATGPSEQTGPPNIANDSQTTSASGFDATTSSIVKPTEHSGSDSREEQNTTGPSEQTDQVAPTNPDHNDVQHVEPVPENADSDDCIPNIIIFGESGIGKSSLINMITGTSGSDSAATSNKAVGCTFESTSYAAKLQNRTYRLWDTVGLNEGERGTASPDKSIQNLQQLVLNLKNEGVHLLVYCIRGSRLRDIVKINYDLFWKDICSKKVPIVLVATGLEHEENMDNWWEDNREDFNIRGMRFSDHACITTTKGKRMKDGKYMFQAEFDRSVQLAQDLIVKCYSKTAWKPNSSQPSIDIVNRMRQRFFQASVHGHSEDVDRRSPTRSGENHRDEGDGSSWGRTLAKYLCPSLFDMSGYTAGYKDYDDWSSPCNLTTTSPHHIACALVHDTTTSSPFVDKEN